MRKGEDVMKRKSPFDDNAIIRRIVKESGIPNLISFLNHLPSRDLQSLLIHVFQYRVQRRTAKDIIDVYQKKYSYIGVSELDQRELIHFDNLFYSVVPKEFDAVELSPICSLGINGVLAKISQNNILSTIRGFEVVSDPTIILALECALRRKTLLEKEPKSTEAVNLCTNQRLLRLQPFDQSKGYMQHFKCIGMCTGNRNIGYKRFAIDNIIKHLAVYIDFIQVLNVQGFTIENVIVYLSDIRIIEMLIAYAGVDKATVMKNTLNPDFKLFERYGIQLPATIDSLRHLDLKSSRYYKIEKSIALLSEMEHQVITTLQTYYPWVKFGFNLARIAGISYYTDLCFHIYGTNQDGLMLQLVDGGFTDWIKKLLNNEKELLLISGFGAELVHKMFKK